MTGADSGWPAAQRAIRDRSVHPAGRFVPFERAALEGTLSRRFRAQAARHPDRLAVRTRRHALTYAALDRAARGVAHRLHEALDGGPAPVALLLEQGAPAIGAALGVLHAGQLCVVLDPTHPRARTAHILQDSRAGALLTDRAHAGLARDWAGPMLVIEDIEPTEAEPPAPGTGPDDPAWLLYTSGTTGLPKGVAHSSRTLLHLIMNYTNAIHICPADRLTALRSMSVIGGVRDALAALLNGASLHPLDVRAEGVPALAPWMREQGITVAFLGSPLFRVFAETLAGEGSLPGVRVLRLGSDTVRPSDVELYRRHLPPACVLVNGLGSAETGTVAKLFIDKATTLPHATVPIGYALEDMTPLVLGEDGREVPAGDAGELAVRSRYLALGYWNRPDLTAAAFRPDPAGGDARLYLTGGLARRHADGCVEHLGRRDFQVQVRGFRVELAEIETALLAVQGVRETVVVPRREGASESRLVAYIVAAGRPAPAPDAVRRALAATLPEHMVPAAVVTLDALPLNAHGKVDRAALPAPPRTRPDLDVPFVAPRTPIEARLAAIWGEVLGLDRVGVLDPFLDLGGDSLLAARVITRALDALAVPIPVRALLESPTVAAMTVAVVDGALGAPGGAAPA